MFDTSFVDGPGGRRCAGAVDTTPRRLRCNWRAPALVGAARRAPRGDPSAARRPGRFEGPSLGVWFGPTG